MTQPQTNARRLTAVSPPQAEQSEPAAPPAQRTLAAELKAALAKSAELEQREKDLQQSLQDLALQRDRLAVQAADVDAQVTQLREAHAQALLAGEAPTGRTKVLELIESKEAIAAAQRAIETRTKQADEALMNVRRLRLEHETGTVADFRWRIALARYALVVRDLLPLARELGKLAHAQRRSLIYGQGLVLDPRSEDIVGIPLSLALLQAENLGNLEGIE